MKKRQLTFQQRLLAATTLFGMFFGAGNLIFPVHLGQIAGRMLLPASAGFILTAVGIPILGVAAIGNTHSNGLQDLANRVGPRYSVLFTCLLYLTIGPFFAIPRCATTSFTIGLFPMLGPSVPESRALFWFSLVFFALVLFFSLRPANITVWIGKVINPVFLCCLAVLVFAALLHPGASAFSAEPEPAYQTRAFFSALIEGYGTMDAIAGLAFGIVVVDIIRRMGVQDDTAAAGEVLASGILAGLLMAAIYLLTILMGAQSRGLFAIADNGGTALAQIAGHYLGRIGSLVLALTITLACLKTSIGLVTSCAETFSQMFPRRFSYSVWAILFTCVSFGISNFGLSAIISYSLPVLMLLYPLSIVLILMALSGNLFEHDPAIYQCVTLFTLAAALFDFINALPPAVQSRFGIGQLLAFAERTLPWFELNLGWVVPALIGLAIGSLIHFMKQPA